MVSQAISILILDETINSHNLYKEISCQKLQYKTFRKQAESADLSKSFYSRLMKNIYQTFVNMPLNMIHFLLLINPNGGERQ
jgi:hypothetical protein